MNSSIKILKAYLFPLSLIIAISLGGLIGYFFGPLTIYLKPVGEIFINLIFTAIVPLIFFSISSAIAKIDAKGKLGRIMSSMGLVYLVTSVMVALYALMVVLIFPLAQNLTMPVAEAAKMSVTPFAEQIVRIFTVPDFYKILSHQHMLALIIFSVLVGLSLNPRKEKKAVFVQFLIAGELVFMRVFEIIMYTAPVGFFAYFAVLVNQIGPDLMGQYVHIALVYYLSALLFFVVAYSFYAYLSGKKTGLKLFWPNVLIPMLTALATSSSAASIPANLAATKKMMVPVEIADTTIPLGSLIHKDGSVIGGMFKIAFLFGLFQMDFSSATVLLQAIGVSIMVGTVMGAIPSGGMLGELLILSVYGFPPSVLIVIAAVSILIDPLATMLNVTGNSVASMMIARLAEGKQWYKNREI